jgi:hypothetical protein
MGIIARKFYKCKGEFVGGFDGGTPEEIANEKSLTGKRFEAGVWGHC